MQNTHRHLIVSGSSLTFGALLMALGSSWRLSELSPVLVGLATVVLAVGFFALVARAGSPGDVFKDRTWAWGAVITLVIGVGFAALVLPGITTAVSALSPLLPILVLAADMLIAVGAVTLGVQFWNARDIPSRYRRVLGGSAVGAAAVTLSWLLVTSGSLATGAVLLVGSFDFLVQMLALVLVGLTITRLAEVKRAEKPNGEPIYGRQTSNAAEWL